MGITVIGKGSWNFQLGKNEELKSLKLEITEKSWKVAAESCADVGKNLPTSSFPISFRNFQLLDLSNYTYPQQCTCWHVVFKLLDYWGVSEIFPILKYTKVSLYNSKKWLFLKPEACGLLFYNFCDWYVCHDLFRNLKILEKSITPSCPFENQEIYVDGWLETH